MADVLQNIQIKGGGRVNTVLHDNTDGTYSPQVYFDPAGVTIGAVTVTEIAAGTNNIGDVDIASIAAGTNNIGDVDVATIAAGTNTIGGVRDAGPAWTSVFGVAGACVVDADVSTATAITDAPTGGQKLVVDDVFISTSGALLIDIEEETSATVIAAFYMAANSTYHFQPRGKVKLATADKKLMVKASGAGEVRVLAVYHSEA